jgi:hypothetical protein
LVTVWKAPYLYLKIVAEWKGIEFTPPLKNQQKEFFCSTMFLSKAQRQEDFTTGKLRKENLPVE